MKWGSKMNRLQINKLYNPPFYVAEALNQLRINLGFCGDNIKVIMVTSTHPNEGKSFISLNVWRSMASVGSKVLLIDCDLRNSVMKTDRGIKSDKPIEGISHYLAGKIELEDAIYETNIENAYMVPMISAVPNPAMLLENERFRKLIEYARENFDYVILDTPPLGSVADALNITTLCDGSVLVVRANETPRSNVIDSVNALKRTTTPLLGVVLNRAKLEKRSGSYYYYHYDYNDKGQKIRK